jgi:hypothetical protein
VIRFASIRGYHNGALGAPRGVRASCTEAMMRTVTAVLSLVLVAQTGLPAQAPPAKAEVVMVAGCLREPTPGEWRVVNATDPTSSNANAPAAADLPSLPVVGKNQFHLIGVSIFDLPSHKDRTVVLKGLWIPAKPLSRLNITSVVTVAPSCSPAK